MVFSSNQGEVKSVRVYILGIDHEIQVTNGQRTDEEKLEYGKLVEALLSQYCVTFIGEETFAEKKAIARVIADLFKIRWEPIEMSANARTELGIAEEQAYERYEAIWANNLVVGSKGPKRVLSDHIREEYMVWRTLTTAETAESILVLCGFMHAAELGKLFERERCDVTVDTLCNYQWYLHPTDCAQLTTFKND
jgi:hypothetical protein